MANKLFSKIMDFIGMEGSPDDEIEDMGFMDDQNDEILSEDARRRNRAKEREAAAFHEAAERSNARNYPSDTAAEPERERPQMRKQPSKIVNMPGSNSSYSLQMVVNQPRSFDDAQLVVDELKVDRPVVVNLETLDPDVAQRVLDFLCGSIYAVNGSLQKVSRFIFVFAPSNVEISGNVVGEEPAGSFIDLGGRFEY